MATATQIPVQSPFGSRIQPQHVTEDIRSKLANFETKIELIAIGCTAGVIGFMAFGLWTFYRFYGRTRGSEFTGMVPLLIAFALIACGIHIVYQWRREMWLTWPATSAVVTHLESTWHRFQESQGHRPELTLRYLAKPNLVLDPDQLKWTPGVYQSTALLQGAYDWALSLQENSLVTIVYDPDKPEKLRVVELNEPPTPKQ
jgi:hypothetical protein